MKVCRDDNGAGSPTAANAEPKRGTACDAEKGIGPDPNRTIGSGEGSVPKLSTVLLPARRKL